MSSAAWANPVIEGLFTPTGSELSSADRKAIHSVASEVMDTLNRETASDPEKLRDLLDRAKKDPDSFKSRYLTAEQRERLRKIENGKSATR